MRCAAFFSSIICQRRFSCSALTLSRYMSLDCSSLSVRSLTVQVFSSLGLLAFCSSVTYSGRHWLFWLYSSYSPLHLIDGISFLGKACADVNELFDLFQGCSTVSDFVFATTAAAAAATAAAATTTTTTTV